MQSQSPRGADARRPEGPKARRPEGPKGLGSPKRTQWYWHRDLIMNMVMENNGDGIILTMVNRDPIPLMNMNNG